MRDDQFHFLTLLGHLPARLNTEQAAWVLNCQAHDVPVLVSARLLKPLGNPQPNSVKYFAAAEIVELTKDRAWLAKMTNAVSQHWKQKNRNKSACVRLDEKDSGSTQIDLPVSKVKIAGLSFPSGLKESPYAAQCAT